MVAIQSNRQGALSTGGVTRRLRRLVLTALLGLVAMTSSPVQAARLKDMAFVKGVRTNQLIGYGLVVGLASTGDGPSSIVTVQSLASLLAGMGITLDSSQLKVKNVAAVMVTANLPSFSRIGGKIDVLVSSMGDAKSLAGGTLILTPLKAPNGDVYAVAQGPLTIGGFGASGAGASTTQNHLTVGQIPSGALVEREVPFELNGRDQLELILRNADFTTATRMEGAINERLAAPVATARDSGSIVLKVPANFRDRIPEMIALIEDLDVPVDSVARVVLNERTGTVIMGEHVRISRVAVAHGNLTLQIETTPVISQPGQFANTGSTVATQEVKVKATEEKKDGPALKVVEGATIGDVVGALNALGVSPRDLIVILQAIRNAGALQADIELL